MKKVVEEDGLTVSLLDEPIDYIKILMPDMPVKKKRGRPPGSKKRKRGATMKVMPEEPTSISTVV